MKKLLFLSLVNFLWAGNIDLHKDSAIPVTGIEGNLLYVDIVDRPPTIEFDKGINLEECLYDLNGNPVLVSNIKFPIKVLVYDANFIPSEISDKMTAIPEEGPVLIVLPTVPVKTETEE